VGFFGHDDKKCSKLSKWLQIMQLSKHAFETRASYMLPKAIRELQQALNNYQNCSGLIT